MAPDLREFIEMMLRSRKQEVALLEKLLHSDKKVVDMTQNRGKIVTTGDSPLDSGAGSRKAERPTNQLSNP